jgi:hypothetical protein
MACFSSGDCPNMPLVLDGPKISSKRKGTAPPRTAVAIPLSARRGGDCTLRKVEEIAPVRVFRPGRAPRRIGTVAATEEDGPTKRLA